jgi:hypothetical protein
VHTANGDPGEAGTASTTTQSRPKPVAAWRGLQRAYFGTFEFTACMNSMNARKLCGVWARFA